MPKLFSVQKRELNTNQQKSLIVWGENSIGLRLFKGIWGDKLTKKQKEIIKLPKKVKSILIGILLSDGWIQRSKKNWSPRIGIKQSIKNVSFLLTILIDISYLCPPTKIILNSNNLRGKLFHTCYIQTRALSIFMEVIKLLYIDKNGKLVRNIQEELVSSLDYITLAYWIMGDANKLHGGLVLNTNGFTLKEVIMLTNMLIINFKINPTLHKDRGRYKIYIWKKDLEKIKPKIEPYIIPHFKYKIN